MSHAIDATRSGSVSDDHIPTLTQPLPHEAASWALAPLRANQSGRLVRDLDQLPAGFLGNLIEHYLPVALSRLRTLRALLDIVLPDPGDLRQQTVVWILETATTYDADQGVPFGGYLSTLLHHRPVDLVRDRLGRATSDWHTRIVRARRDFREIEQRSPTGAELAALLDIDEATLRRWLERIEAVVWSYRPVDLSSVHGPLRAGWEYGQEVHDGFGTSDEVIERVDRQRAHALVTTEVLRCALGRCTNPEHTSEYMGLTAWLLVTSGEYRKNIAALGHVPQRTLSRRMRLFTERLPACLPDQRLLLDCA